MEQKSNSTVVENSAPKFSIKLLDLPIFETGEVWSKPGLKFNPSMFTTGKNVNWVSGNANPPPCVLDNYTLAGMYKSKDFPQLYYYKKNVTCLLPSLKVWMMYGFVIRVIRDITDNKRHQCPICLNYHCKGCKPLYWCSIVSAMCSEKLFKWGEKQLTMVQLVFDILPMPNDDLHAIMAEVEAIRNCDFFQYLSTNMRGIDTQLAATLIDYDRRKGLDTESSSSQSSSTVIPTAPTLQSPPGSVKEPAEEASSLKDDVKETRAVPEITQECAKLSKALAGDRLPEARPPTVVVEEEAVYWHTIELDNRSPTKYKYEGPGKGEIADVSVTTTFLRKCVNVVTFATFFLYYILHTILKDWAYCLVVDVFCSMMILALIVSFLQHVMGQVRSYVTHIAEVSVPYVQRNITMAYGKQLDNPLLLGHYRISHSTWYHVWHQDILASGELALGVAGTTGSKEKTRNDLEMDVRRYAGAMKFPTTSPGDPMLMMSFMMGTADLAQFYIHHNMCVTNQGNSKALEGIDWSSRGIGYTKCPLPLYPTPRRDSQSLILANFSKAALFLAFLLAITFVVVVLRSVILPITVLKWQEQLNVLVERSRVYQMKTNPGVYTLPNPSVGNTSPSQPEPSSPLSNTVSSVPVIQKEEDKKLGTQTSLPLTSSIGPKTCGIDTCSINPTTSENTMKETVRPSPLQGLNTSTQGGSMREATLPRRSYFLYFILLTIYCIPFLLIRGSTRSSRASRGLLYRFMSRLRWER